MQLRGVKLEEQISVLNIMYVSYMREKDSQSDEYYSFRILCRNLLNYLLFSVNATNHTCQTLPCNSQGMNKFVVIVDYFSRKIVT